MKNTLLNKNQMLFLRYILVLVWANILQILCTNVTSIYKYQQMHRVELLQREIIAKKLDFCAFPIFKNVQIRVRFLYLMEKNS